jgi:hypothetical protein
MPSPTSTQVIAGLQPAPLLSIAEMRAALDAHRLAHGIYAWWLDLCPISGCDSMTACSRL